MLFQPIAKAAGIVGSQAKLGRRLNVSRGLVWQWAHGRFSVAPARCVQIEQLTNGQVTRRDLRPHDWARIWPELAKEGSDANN